MIRKRILLEEFLSDLNTDVLSPVLIRVKDDETLLLTIRYNYINIYYRGGNLLKISVAPNLSSHSTVPLRTYCCEFDINYNKGYTKLDLIFPIYITSTAEASSLVSKISGLKFVMDRFFARNSHAEREFQQLVVRENNSSSISHETDYFIIDIEVAGLLPNVRYDMLAVRWLNRSRGRSGMLVPAIIEMKYGSGALEGASGIGEHLKDVRSLVSNKADWLDVIEGLEAQLHQLDELGLLSFHKSSKKTPLKISHVLKTEFILIISNYNPAGVKLQRVLSNINEAECEESGIDLRFFVPAFAGYGMHRASMLNLKDFTSEVNRLHAIALQKQE